MPHSLMRENTGEVVYRSLRNAIERGTLKPGQLIASRRALQTKLEVSHHAVRTGLERLEREGWIIRRHGAGTYVADRLSHKLCERPRVLCLLIDEGFPRLQNFIRPLVKAIGDEAADRGIHLRVEDYISPDLPPDKTEAEAVLWIAPHCRRALAIPPRNIPMVIISHEPETLPAHASTCDLVTGDVLQGAFLAGEYLRKQGCCVVAAIGRAMPDGKLAPTFATRLRGFEMGWGEMVAPENILRTQAFNSHEGARVAGQMLRRRKRPDALFAACDELAYGACHAALAYGVAVGAELRVIGFDGQPRREASDPILTTVAAPLEEMGRTAVRCAIERIEHPRMRSRRIELTYALQKGETA